MSFVSKTLQHRPCDVVDVNSKNINQVLNAVTLQKGSKIRFSVWLVSAGKIIRTKHKLCDIYLLYLKTHLNHLRVTGKRHKTFFQRSQNEEDCWLHSTSRKMVSGCSATPFLPSQPCPIAPLKVNQDGTWAMTRVGHSPAIPRHHCRTRVWPGRQPPGQGRVGVGWCPAQQGPGLGRVLDVDLLVLQFVPIAPLYDSGYH